ncbi:helix-turn-helix domain-containing protein [Nocardioides daejeonensis]|uniref:helix-turn-helix domain-containing protein n=1 Tax=Nocardioides daejeonensis TaxID=1046556 RepID=UPI0013A58CD6|nr:helix-turn-helix transcriptional regulator [Nocardioides daejeonensis]
MEAQRIVRELLEVSGMSKAQLSRKSGVSRSAIDAYLAGGASPTLRQIDRLAAAAGCEVVTRVRRRSAAPPVPESLVAVLEFGELFPQKERKPPAGHERGVVEGA